MSYKDIVIIRRLNISCSIVILLLVSIPLIAENAIAQKVIDNEILSTDHDNNGDNDSKGDND